MTTHRCKEYMLYPYSDENGYFCQNRDCKYAYQSYPRNQALIVRDN